MLGMCAFLHGNITITKIKQAKNYVEQFHYILYNHVLQILH